MTLAWGEIYNVVVRGCWAIFFVVWTAGAVYNLLKGPPTEQRRLGLSAWVVGIALIVAARILVPRAVWAELTLDAALVRGAGVVLLVLSTLFTVWARLILGTMWSSLAVIKHKHQLRTTGPYAITRHPIYTGILGMLLGTMLMSDLGVWVFYFAVAVVLLTIKASVEERLLLEQFGGTYRDYQHRVAQLIPNPLHLGRERST